MLSKLANARDTAATHAINNLTYCTL